MRRFTQRVKAGARLQLLSYILAMEKLNAKEAGEGKPLGNIAETRHG